MIADFDTELVALVPSRRRAHLLEPMWALVVDSCRSGDTYEALVADLSDATGQTEDDVAAWVGQAVAALERSGVLSSAVAR